VKELKTNRLTILGAAESGIGAAILGKRKGWDVFVSDGGKIKDDFKNELLNQELEFEEEGHLSRRILDTDLIIKSPGISDKHAIIVEAHRRGIPVLSEIEFARKYTNAKIVSITGTNGKTTTTMLTWHIMKKAGLHVGLAGNIGKSFARQVAENDFDYYVLELSSFQLDGVYEFRSDVSVLLNITPDHLDRYDYKLDYYINAKFRIADNQNAEDVFIYNADDSIIQAELQKRKIKAQLIPISLHKISEQGAYIHNQTIHISYKTDPLTMSIFDLALQGKHNQYNSMAAGISARVFDIRKDSIRESLMDFESIEHRLEVVTKVHGIEFINDSKATNVNSTWYALETMNNPVIWIVGGIDKGNDYAMLKDLVKKRVKAIVCLGLDNVKIHEAFADLVPQIVDTQSAKDAVKAAYLLGKKGDVVLLSPACASFDLFENYEDRGRQFKTAVREL